MVPLRETAPPVLRSYTLCSIGLVYSRTSTRNTDALARHKGAHQFDTPGLDLFVMTRDTESITSLKKGVDLTANLDDSENGILELNPDAAAIILLLPTAAEIDGSHFQRRAYSLARVPDELAAMLIVTYLEKGTDERPSQGTGKRADCERL